MEERVRVAAAQLSPVFMNKEASLDKACKAIESAGKAGAKLVVFSETFIPGYPYWRGILPISKWSNWMVEYQKNSLKIPSPDLDLLCEVSRDAAVITVIGCSEVSDVKGSATLYNTILFINNNGKFLGRHRKIMPTHAERMIWGMGNAEDIAVFDTPIGRIGGLVCYEHHMTLQKAAMAALGEEIHCALWPGWWVMEHHPGDKRRWREGDSPYSCDIEHAVREYAFENQVFAISVGQYISDDVMPLDCRDFNVAAGGSFIVNPAGVIMAGPVFNKEEILYADLSAEDRALTKAYFDTLGHYSRPDLFRLEIIRGTVSGNRHTHPSEDQDRTRETVVSYQSGKTIETRKR